MRNAALLVLLIALVVAALTGVLAGPLLVGGAIVMALFIGRALHIPGDRSGDSMGDAQSARTAKMSPTGPRTRIASEHTTHEPSPLAGIAARSDERDNRRELDNGIRLVCESVGAQAGLLWRVDAAGETVRPAAAHDREPPLARALRGDPLGWVAKEGTPLRLDPAPAWAAPDSRVIALRLWQRENRGWLLTLEFPAESNPDAAALDAAAAPLRLLVELQERRFETDADRRRLNSLLDILHRIPVATELEPAAGELIEACMQLTGATGGTVGMWDGDAGRIVGVSGDDGGPQMDAVFTSPSSELALAVRAGGTLIRLQGSWKPGPTQIANATDQWDARPRTFAAVPLSTSSGTTSVLCVWNSTDAPLDPGGIDLIRAIAPYAALHLKHASEFGRLKETAETDGLTGLRNRRAFDAALLLESSRYDRYARPLSLLMIDIDHFKSVNDRFGHEAGDEVLRQVADIVKSCVRDVDTAARFGGEELAVLLPETARAAAREVAERIRLTIAGRPVQWAQASIGVTVSVGLSCVPESVATAGALLTKADEALYAAKTGGRNRVVSPEGPPSHTP